MGFAWQDAGWLPVPAREPDMRAIELNGAAVQGQPPRGTFAWGRRGGPRTLAIGVRNVPPFPRPRLIEFSKRASGPRWPN